MKDAGNRDDVLRSGRRAINPPAERRYMSLRRVAEYCDMSVPTFKRVFGGLIKPVKLPPTRGRTKSLARYDKKIVDRTLDSLSGITSGPAANDPESEAERKADRLRRLS